MAELVDALDLGSSILGCESSSLSFRTTFLIRIKIISNFLVGISPSGKAPGFDPGIPRFKSWYPSQFAHIFDYTSRFILNSNYIIYIFYSFSTFITYTTFSWHKKRPKFEPFHQLTKLTTYCVF